MVSNLFAHKLRASGIHAAISLVLAAAVGALVFGVWFAYPYRDLAGGQHLFWIIVGVDVVCGPLLTLVLFNPRKSRRELTLDLSLVALIQLGALVYGLYSLSLARPVVLAFEVDRFVAVAPADIDRNDLPHALPAYQRLSWTGPVLVGTRLPKDGPEMLASVELSLRGIEPSARPSWWQPYDQSVPDIRQRMKAVTSLRGKLSPSALQALDASVKKSGIALERLHYLPMTSAKKLDDWVVLLDDNAQIVGYAPVDGFM